MAEWHSSASALGVTPFLTIFIFPPFLLDLFGDTDGNGLSIYNRFALRVNCTTSQSELISFVCNILSLGVQVSRADSLSTHDRFEKNFKDYQVKLELKLQNTQFDRLASPIKLRRIYNFTLLIYYKNKK